jgi:hypothetical protein
MSSSRAEMCGLFAAITHLRLVVEYYAIIPNKNDSCRISKGALARVADQYYDGFGTTRRCRPLRINTLNRLQNIHERT